MSFPVTKRPLRGGTAVLRGSGTLLWPQRGPVLRVWPLRPWASPAQHPLPGPQTGVRQPSCPAATFPLAFLQLHRAGPFSRLLSWPRVLRRWRMSNMTQKRSHLTPPPPPVLQLLVGGWGNPDVLNATSLNPHAGSTVELVLLMTWKHSSSKWLQIKCKLLTYDIQF